MDRIDILLSITIITSFSIRLYPTLLTALPFSTDSWPLIFNTENLLRHTPISLEDKVFDGYNNYWPASQVFGAIASIILNARVLDVERILFPATSSLTPIILYMIVKKTIGSRAAAAVSSLLLALGGYQAIFTSGVTKETFILLVFFTYLYLVFVAGGTVTRCILLSITGAAIVMSHHLQYFLLLAIFSSILVLRLLLRWVDDDGPIRLIPALITLLILGAIYYPLYALRGVAFSLTTSDILSVTSFQVLSLLLSYYALTGSGASTPPISLFIVWGSLYVAASLTILLINQLSPVLPGSPKLPASIVIQLSILLMLGLLVSFGIGSSSRRESSGNTYHMVGWLSAILSLQAYSMFGAQPALSLTLFYRLANHVLPPVFILASNGLVRIIDFFRGKHLRVMCLAAIVLPISLTLVYQHYSSTILQENYLGYQWSYNKAEYEFASWLPGRIGNLRVCGDMKVKYLLEGYFRIRVDEAGGFKILNGERLGEESLIVTYRVMGKNGYVLGPYGVELKQGWVKSISDRADKVFSNVFTEAYNVS